MVASGATDPTGNNGGATVYNVLSWCKGEKSGGVANATGPNVMCPSSWCETGESCEEVESCNHLLNNN